MENLPEDRIVLNPDVVLEAAHEAVEGIEGQVERITLERGGRSDFVGRVVLEGQEDYTGIYFSL